LLQVFAALVEEIASPPVCLTRRLLRLLQQLAAALRQEFPGLAPGLGGDDQSDCGTGYGAEKKPARISRRVIAALVSHRVSSLVSKPLDEDLESLLHSNRRAGELTHLGETREGADHSRHLRRRVLQP